VILCAFFNSHLPSLSLGLPGLEREQDRYIVLSSAFYTPVIAIFLQADMRIIGDVWKPAANVRFWPEAAVCVGLLTTLSRQFFN
jgi:energy-converting hydrogenase Eha subunit A